MSPDIVRAFYPILKTSRRATSIYSIGLMSHAPCPCIRLTVGPASPSVVPSPQVSDWKSYWFVCNIESGLASWRLRHSLCVTYKRNWSGVRERQARNSRGRGLQCALQCRKHRNWGCVPPQGPNSVVQTTVLQHC